MFTKYPLFMVTQHPSYRMHDDNDSNPSMGDVNRYLTDPLHGGDTYQATIGISPEDASARGILDGDLVRVYNDVGEGLVKAAVLPIMMPGVVAIPEGRWIDLNSNGQDTRGCTNNLTYDGNVGEQAGIGYMHSPAGAG